MGYPQFSSILSDAPWNPASSYGSTPFWDPPTPSSPGGALDSAFSSLGTLRFFCSGNVQLKIGNCPTQDISGYSLNQPYVVENLCVICSNMWIFVPKWFFTNKFWDYDLQDKENERNIIENIILQGCLATASRVPVLETMKVSPHCNIGFHRPFLEWYIGFQAANGIEACSSGISPQKLGS